MKALTRKLLILAFFITPSLLSNAQGFYHSLGTQLHAGSRSFIYSTPYIDYTGNQGFAVPSIFYKATYMFNSDIVSFGVSSYPSVGADSNNMNGTSLGYELPILVEVYFGNIEENCFFIGAGFSKGHITKGGSSLDKLDASGPQILLGGQFTLRGQDLGVKLSYTLATNNLTYPSDFIVTEDMRYMITLGVYYML